MAKNPAVIFDIDGTLANVNHRRHFVEKNKNDFDSFYAHMVADSINKNIKTLCNMYFNNGFKIIICTGRPEKYREITKTWLLEHGIYYERLLMRPDCDRYAPDYKIKKVMLDFIRDIYNIELAVDDRDQVVKMWRENGVTCLQCAEGNF